jgi:hypothetical protein
LISLDVPTIGDGIVINGMTFSSTRSLIRAIKNKMNKKVSEVRMDK